MRFSFNKRPSETLMFQTACLILHHKKRGACTCGMQEKGYKTTHNNGVDWVGNLRFQTACELAGLLTQ